MTGSPILDALLVGLIASSSLVIGGIVGALFDPPGRLVAVALAFASGALITALSFDLIEESFQSGGVVFSGIGMLAGAGVFVITDSLLDKYIEGAAGGVSGFAILAAVTLDGVPENMALGVSLLSGTSVLTLLIAIFASNFPEALSGAVGMKEQGRTKFFVISVWTVTALILAADVVLGSAVLSRASGEALSLLLAFAGGAVLASLADTLMPDAYREGGGLVAFATVAGFFLSFMVEKI
ncbi:MAG: ZIP family metal transporter [Rubrobacteraceae bacterium]|jgi:ZIP family zinc transporter|nr:zinc permease [Rubrobacter sp.]